MRDKRSARKLYTLLLEFSGTTSVSQVEALDPNEAFRLWTAKLEGTDAYGLSGHAARDLRAAIGRQDDHSIVSIDGLTGVWCTTSLVNQDLAILHVIETQVRAEISTSANQH